MAPDTQNCPDVQPRVKAPRCTVSSKKAPNGSSKKRRHPGSTHIRIGTLNVHSAKSESDLAACAIESKSLGHDVCLLQETWRNGQSEFAYTDTVLRGWRVLHNGLQKDQKAGIAFVLSPSATLHDVSHLVPGRLSSCRLSIRGQKISLVNFYGFTNIDERSPQSQRRALFDKLAKCVRELKKSHPTFKILVGGDFNATIGADDESAAFGPNRDTAPTNFNGQLLLETAQDLGLFCMESFLKSRDAHRHTFYSNLGYARKLDYFLGEWYIKHFTHRCRVYRGATRPFNSDHRLLVLDACFPTKAERKSIFRQKKAAAPAPDIPKLRDDEEIRQNFSDQLDGLLPETPVTASVDDLEQTICAAISNAASTAIPKKSKQRSQPPWTNPEFLRLVTTAAAAQIQQSTRIWTPPSKSSAANSKTSFSPGRRTKSTWLARCGAWRRNFGSRRATKSDRSLNGSSSRPKNYASMP